MLKKEKKKKLDSLPKIHRRLFKIWSEKIRDRAKNTCEYCGIKKGEMGKNGKIITKLDSHHYISRIKKDSYLKWDLENGVCACSGCHKFSEDSFHRSPVTTMNWLIKNHPERFNYILEHFDDKVDIDNRFILSEIERCLLNNESLDFAKLKQIEKEFPRELKKPTTTTTTTKIDIDLAFQEIVQL